MHQQHVAWSNLIYQGGIHLLRLVAHEYQRQPGLLIHAQDLDSYCFVRAGQTVTIFAVTNFNNPPSPPVNPSVSKPRDLATSSVVTTFVQFPCGEKPIAMSWGRANVLRWCAKVNPAFPSANTPLSVALSLVSARAGSARLPTITGCTNSTETCWASVAHAPFPKASSRPPW